jgi:hypothetical protein
MTTKYEYSHLKEITVQNEQYNFYGVILDATYPNPEEDNPNEYICSLKLIDDTLNPKLNQQNFDDEVINVIIKSNSKENLPYIHSAGEIFRVHRGFFVSLILIYYFDFSLFNFFRAQKIGRMSTCPSKKEANISKVLGHFLEVIY